MFSTIKWKPVLIGFTWALSLAGLVILMSFISIKKSDLLCKDLKVLIPGTQSFVERSEVDNILLTTQGPVIGRLLNKINIHKLESTLKRNPFIEDAKVYADMDGVIQVQIKQREPVIRVINLTNQDFYIDKNGYKIPTSKNFTARVIAANGNILENFGGRSDTLNTKVARDLFKTAIFIQKDTLWNDQIEQLYVNEQSEIEMIPRVGNQRIILGDADSLQNKFRNLLVFYKKAMPKVGWDTYKTINIKYTNQVVCVKNDTTKINQPVPVQRKAEKIKLVKDTITNTTH